MKNSLFFILFFISFNLFSQEKEQMSYFFNNSSEFNLKQHNQDFFSNVVSFTNTKDSSYTLNLYKSKDSVFATLYDYKNKMIINYDVDFTYSDIEDLKKLKVVSLLKDFQFDKGKKFKNYVENYEIEKDDKTNTTIIHLTQYKNSKRKKIINEHYYFFTNKNGITNFNDENIKNRLLKEYNLNEIKDLNLEKTICIVNNKNDSESEIINIKKINYTFTFSIDENNLKNTFFKK